MTLPELSLDDQYTVDHGRIFLTGTQALVRLPLMQRQRDLAAGLDTAGFISGYRGSPLGGLDQQLWKARKHLQKHHVVFNPGINEDLAMTSVWGSQQANMDNLARPEHASLARYDGVFGMWYGKGPGVDRSGDVMKHGNMAGSSRHGGVLLLAGDDHGAKSSTLPHQAEYTFMDCLIPVLNPSGVQEILDYGLIGWALSRFSGAWVGMKTIADTVDSSASVSVAPDRVTIVLPDFDFPADGVNIRWPDAPMDQEYRHHRYRLYAALAFARANRLDRVVLDSPRARFGIVTTGKSYLDVMQALEELGIDERLAAEIGIRLYKVGMSWPLEREGARAFAEGLDEVLVVEEKRAVIENQFKEQLYDWKDEVRPRVVGKFDEQGNWILPSAGELRPSRIARVIGERLARFYTNERIQSRLDHLRRLEDAVPSQAAIERKPTYCSGCPHNTSTVVPEGSRALGGIGCHYMATWIMPRTETYTQMGAEGTSWIGQAPFTTEKHVFQNLGDGTYFHSGVLAIRAAIAAKVNITYKILFNDAVAMTGGQPIDGSLTIQQMAHELVQEGVTKLVVVTDDTSAYAGRNGLPHGTDVYDRGALDEVQRMMREVDGCSIIIYQQTCATEKRRRRKRGLMDDPDRRVFINDLVCEGCGDCSAKSHCVSVQPLETEYGRKRQIDQSSCNKDYSCVEGFCPSFVTVQGASIRKPRARDAGRTPFETLPHPVLPTVGADPYSILVAGIGGTGVVTIGALIGVAAHLEGKGVGVLDMTGMAQKGGGVFTHLRIAKTPEDIHSIRIATGGADLMIAADLVVGARPDALVLLDPARSTVLINDHELITAGFISNPDLRFPGQDLRDAYRRTAGAGNVDLVAATRIATTLLGDSIATNLFLLGYAWQKGLVPLEEASILSAIEINGVAVTLNQDAFMWGRRAAHDLQAVQTIVERNRPVVETERLSETLDEVIARRVDFLTGYQNAAWAARYRQTVEQVRAAEAARTPGRIALTDAVARSLFKLMAYKDEYEVARLYTDGRFLEKLNRQFEGDVKLTFHLAPPMIAPRDPRTGRMRKMRFGGATMRLFKLMARLKGLRGTPFDIFGYTAERRAERRLIDDYRQTVDRLINGLTPATHARAVEIARLAMDIRGFGHVKDEALTRTRLKEQRLLAAYDGPAPAAVAAE
ncbi:indolepyruvate ferredoxin oxidoreductase [Tistrella bauzanensis]|uniref:Indolepyruvate ferredoxin oxidoreductase n=1 Tax=Tistrella bauzanensis TaxID=657419 RepID=A0ABQ1I7H3_9PROT|nr:indolepyruvate ferredoxin oxidoreductase family protein [Tistrella bauzanensis]GGB23186.1 indolepyruvate ferredoxin oxidoreductase [Tistrella bauzanensis]